MRIDIQTNSSRKNHARVSRDNLKSAASAGVFHVEIEPVKVGFLL